MKATEDLKPGDNILLDFGKDECRKLCHEVTLSSPVELSKETSEEKLINMGLGNRLVIFNHKVMTISQALSDKLIIVGEINKHLTITPTLNNVFIDIRIEAGNK